MFLLLILILTICETTTTSIQYSELQVDIHESKTWTAFILGETHGVWLSSLQDHTKLSIRPNHALITLGPTCLWTVCTQSAGCLNLENNYAFSVNLHENITLLPYESLAVRPIRKRDEEDQNHPRRYFGGDDDVFNYADDLAQSKSPILCSIKAIAIHTPFDLIQTWIQPEWLYCPSQEHTLVDMNYNNIVINRTFNATWTHFGLWCLLLTDMKSNKLYRVRVYAENVSSILIFQDQRWIQVSNLGKSEDDSVISDGLYKSKSPTSAMTILILTSLTSNSQENISTLRLVLSTNMTLAPPPNFIYEIITTSPITQWLILFVSLILITTLFLLVIALCYQRHKRNKKERF